MSVDALEEREDVREFVEKYVDDVHDELPLVYYYRLREETYAVVRARLDDRVTGSLFEDTADDRDVDVEALL